MGGAREPAAAVTSQQGKDGSRPHVCALCKVPAVDRAQHRLHLRRSDNPNLCVGQSACRGARGSALVLAPTGAGLLREMSGQGNGEDGQAATRNTGCSCTGQTHLSDCPPGPTASQPASGRPWLGSAAGGVGGCRSARRLRRAQVTVPLLYVRSLFFSTRCQASAGAQRAGRCGSELQSGVPLWDCRPAPRFLLREPALQGAPHRAPRQQGLDPQRRPC